MVAVGKQPQVSGDTESDKQSGFSCSVKDDEPSFALSNSILANNPNVVYAASRMSLKQGKNEAKM